MKIRILTRENITELAKESGRSKEDLSKSLSDAQAKDEVCFIMIQDPSSPFEKKKESNE